VSGKLALFGALNPKSESLNATKTGVLMVNTQ